MAAAAPAVWATPPPPPALLGVLSCQAGLRAAAAAIATAARTALEMPSPPSLLGVPTCRAGVRAAAAAMAAAVRASLAMTAAAAARCAKLPSWCASRGYCVAAMAAAARTALAIPPPKVLKKHSSWLACKAKIVPAAKRSAESATCVLSAAPAACPACEPMLLRRQLSHAQRWQYRRRRGCCCLHSVGDATATTGTARQVELPSSRASHCCREGCCCLHSALLLRWPPPFPQRWQCRRRRLHCSVC